MREPLDDRRGPGTKGEGRVRFTFPTWWLLAVLATVGRAQDPIGAVEVELEGPTPVLELSAGFERTELCLELQGGESRRVLVPFLSRSNLGEDWAKPRLAEGTSARTAHLIPGSVEPPPAWSSLPISLKSRGLPHLPQVRPRAGELHLAWLVGSLLLVLGLRRRPWRAAGLGVAAALTVFWLPNPPLEAPVVRVLEGDGATGRWIEVVGGRERLELARHDVGWLRHLPQGAHRHLEVAEVAGETRWAACAEGARLFYMSEIVAPRQPNSAGTAGHRFAEVWTRYAGGAWVARGPWHGDVPLPESSAARAGPPGWLISGLPQGVSILAARFEAREGESGWLRLVGFE